MGDRPRNIIGDVKAMLEFYEAMGIEGMPVVLQKRTDIEGRTAEKAVGKKAAGAAKAAGHKKSDKAALLREIRDEIGECQRCKLSKSRKNIVFGDGDPNARIMFIGEGPGREEDIQGLPFVGDAGTVLTRLIEKMGLKRSEVYIGNIVKCRPPMNRDPEEDEIKTCRPFIERQIAIIRPEVIVTLGRIALHTLMNNSKLKISAARGNFFEYDDIPLMPTFHPAYLLRNPKDKWLTWADAQKVMEKIGLASN